MVSSFKQQQACDSKHHLIFINSIQAKHLSQIPHHWISADSNHHTPQWHRIISQMHSINGQNKQGIQERAKFSIKCECNSLVMFTMSKEFVQNPLKSLGI